MNISRLSALSLGIVFAVFALGYANPAFAEKVKICPDHPSCKDDDSDNGKDASYSVLISGAVTGANREGELWRGNFGGKSRIGLGKGGGDLTDMNNVGWLTDLDFFINAHFAFPHASGDDSHTSEHDEFPWTKEEGEFCFPVLPLDDGNAGLAEAYLAQVILKVDKRGRAESRFWFNGLTKDSTMTAVTYYLLIGAGTIKGDWPPSSTTTMTLDTWEMKVDGESGPVRNASCVGDGDFVNFGAPTMDIDVTLLLEP